MPQYGIATEARGSNVRCGTATEVHGFSACLIIITAAAGYAFKKECVQMEWNEVLKFMETYWLQQVCVLMVAVITWIYRRQLKKIQRNIQEQQAMRSAMMAL